MEDMLFMEGFEKKTVRTEYGEVGIKEGAIDGKTVVFLNRHGWKYTAPPQVNYRANMAALRDAKVECLLATAAVGAINGKLQPGDLVILEDFIDFTRHRVETFDPNSFLDLSSPYSSFLVDKIKEAAAKLKLKIHPDAIYACVEGPRFETRAEIRMFKKLGANVVGMTQVPEVVLAAEAGIPYGVVGVVTNFAAGVTSKRVSSAEVLVMMREKSEVLSKLVVQIIKTL